MVVEMLAGIIRGWTFLSGHALTLGAFISAAFAGFAYFVRAVTRSGALAGFLICWMLCSGAGLPSLGPLVAVFALAWLTTNFGSQRKNRLQTAEANEGRSAFQLLANLGVAAACAAFYGVTKQSICFAAIVASLSEAAADTVSSEIGLLSNAAPRLITTLQKVPAGTNGGVSLLGTLSGLAAAIVVSYVSVLCGMILANRIWIPLIAAILGMTADSFLGALLERRNLLNNDAVNFLGTLFAALVAVAISL